MTETSSTLRSAGTGAAGAAESTEAAVTPNEGEAVERSPASSSSAPSSSRWPTRNPTSNDRKWIPPPPSQRRGIIEGKKDTKTDLGTFVRRGTNAPSHYGLHRGRGGGGRGRGRGRGRGFIRRPHHHSPRREDVPPPPPPPPMHRVKTFQRLSDAEVEADDGDKENRGRNGTSSTSSSASSAAAAASYSTESSSAKGINRHPLTQGADSPRNNQIKNKLSTKTNSDRPGDLVEAAANRRAAELELLALIGAVRIDDTAIDGCANGAENNDGTTKTAAAKAAGAASSSNRGGKNRNNKYPTSRRKGYRGAGGLKFAAASYDAIVEEATRFANELERIEWERVAATKETNPSGGGTASAAALEAAVARISDEIAKDKSVTGNVDPPTNIDDESLRLKERIEAASAAKHERLARLTKEEGQRHHRDAVTSSEAFITTPVMSNKGSSFLDPHGFQKEAKEKGIPSPVVIEQRIEAASKAKIDRRIEERIAMASAAKRERLQQQQQGSEGGGGAAIAASPVGRQRRLSYASPSASSGTPMQCAVGEALQPPPPRLGYLCPKYGPLHGKAVTTGDYLAGTVYYYPPYGYPPYDPPRAQGGSATATTAMIQDTPTTLHSYDERHTSSGGRTETVEKTDPFAAVTTPTPSMPPHLLPLPSMRKDRPQDIPEEPRTMAPPSSLRVHSQQQQQQQEQAQVKQQQELSERESFLAQQRKREEEAAEILAEERKAVLVETQQNRTAAGKATRVHVPPRKRVNGVR